MFCFSDKQFSIKTFCKDIWVLSIFWKIENLTTWVLHFYVAIMSGSEGQVLPWESSNECPEPSAHIPDTFTYLTWHHKHLPGDPVIRLLVHRHLLLFFLSSEWQWDDFGRNSACLRTAMGGLGVTSNRSYGYCISLSLSPYISYILWDLPLVVTGIRNSRLRRKEV